MRFLKIAGVSLSAWILTMQQVYAGIRNGGGDGGHVIPEIDGSAAIIAIGLLAGVVALVRERFFK